MPVHFYNRPLLACKWEGQVFVNLVLPFGLKLAPEIFTAVADVIEWCFCEAGVRFDDHYLDDYTIRQENFEAQKFCKMSNLSFIVD